MTKTLTWREVSKKTSEELEVIQDSDEYDESTQIAAHEELEERYQVSFEASELQAAYDDEWYLHGH